MHSYYVISGGIWLILALIFCGITAMVGQVLLGVAVYHNAKAYGNSNPGMWCALTVLFSWIPAVIYLATRNSAKNRLMSCPQCNAVHPVGLTNCPHCGAYNGYSEPYHSPYSQQQIATSKKFLIAAIVLLGFSILASIVCVSVFVVALLPYIETHGHSYRYW